MITSTDLAGWMVLLKLSAKPGTSVSVVMNVGES